MFRIAALHEYALMPCFVNVAFQRTRVEGLHHLSKLSRYALQAIVIPDFYTRKVRELEMKKNQGIHQSNPYDLSTFVSWNRF